MSELGAERRCRCGVLVMPWTDGRRQRVVEVYGGWHCCAEAQRPPITPPLTYDVDVLECACGRVVFRDSEGHKWEDDLRTAHYGCVPAPGPLPVGPPAPPGTRTPGGFVEL